MASLWRKYKFGSSDTL